MKMFRYRDTRGWWRIHKILYKFVRFHLDLSLRVADSIRYMQDTVIPANSVLYT